MRRLLPVWSSLFAVLLLSQWSGTRAACLLHVTVHAAPLCVGYPSEGQTAPGTKDEVAADHCPLCAPLPPAILPGPAAVALPRAIHPAITADAAPSWVTPATLLPSPLQARAPPAET